MPEAFLFDHVRTPRGRGRPGGGLSAIPPVHLLARVLEALRDRSIPDTSLIEDVIIGCVSPVGEQGADIARLAVLAAGYDETVPGVQIQRFCSSGLDAVNIAAAKVRAGDVQLCIAGGVESMSRVPMASDGGAWSADPRLAARTLFVPQGISADLLATLSGTSRQALDEYALESQRRAARAWQAGFFSRSIIPVRDGDDVLLERDEYMRPDTTLEALQALKPAFRALGESGGFDEVARHRHPGVEIIDHVHTAGNSSGIVDGAAVMLVGTLEAGRRLGLEPRARVAASANIGTEPTVMLTGPAPSTLRALERARLKPAHVDLFEVNEAFAIVPLHLMRSLEVDPGRVNVNGGAIALGHPLGATGTIILGTLLDELERRRMRFGVATQCVAAGMGTATLIERA